MTVDIIPTACIGAVPAVLAAHALEILPCSICTAANPTGVGHVSTSDLSDCRSHAAAARAPTCTVSSSRLSGHVVVLLPAVLLLRASASSRSSTCGLVNKLNSSAWCSTKCTASTILSPNSLRGCTPEELELLSEPAGTKAPAVVAPGDAPAVPPGGLNSSPWTAAGRASVANQEWGGGREGRAAAAGVCMSRCSRGLRGAHGGSGALQSHRQQGGAGGWDG
jgi:hypothetical protein